VIASETFYVPYFPMFKFEIKLIFHFYAL
jgi:hypothetical protein